MREGERKNKQMNEETENRDQKVKKKISPHSRAQRQTFRRRNGRIAKVIIEA
jgi:hypothetical protein